MSNDNNKNNKMKQYTTKNTLNKIVVHTNYQEITQ